MTADQPQFVGCALCTPGYKTIYSLLLPLQRPACFLGFGHALGVQSSYVQVINTTQQGTRLCTMAVSCIHYINAAPLLSVFRTDEAGAKHYYPYLNCGIQYIFHHTTRNSSVILFMTTHCL